MEKLKKHSKIIAAIMASLIITGCNMNTVSNPLPYERNIADVEDLLKKKAFGKCRDEALQLDGNARSRGVAGGFVTSARVMDGCLNDLGRSAHQRWL